MSAPTHSVRSEVYLRDSRRCISCGSCFMLTVQHRQASGMGGRKRRPTQSELVTACMKCNQSYEADGQAEALSFGWKVPRNIGKKFTVADFPVYYPLEQSWFLLNDDASRTLISLSEVEEFRKEWAVA